MDARIFGILIAAILGIATCASAHDPPEPAVVARIAAARTKLRLARQQLDAARQRMEGLRNAVSPQFERRPEWKPAKQRLDRALSAMQHTKLAAMTKDPHYAPMVLQRDKARTFRLSASGGSDEIPSELLEKAFFSHYLRVRRMNLKDEVEARRSLEVIEKTIEAEDPEVIRATKEFNEGVPSANRIFHLIFPQA